MAHIEMLATVVAMNLEGTPGSMQDAAAADPILHAAMGGMNMAESTGRMLAVQLHKLTDDRGMKKMLSYLIARDTMHQNQWLAAWEELGGAENHPIPNSFDQGDELSEHAYAFYTFHKDGAEKGPMGRWSEGSSIDNKGDVPSGATCADGAGA